MTTPAPAARIRCGEVTDSSGVCPLASGKAGLWNDAGTPKWRKADGSDITISSGGGSTGNWTFSTNNATLAGAAVMGIGLDGVPASINFGSDILPNADITQNSGSVTNRWAGVFAQAVFGYYASGDNLNEQQLAGVQVRNFKAATSGAGNQQYSPGIELTGTQYNVASKRVDGMLQLRSVDGSGRFADLVLWGRYDSGSWGEILSARTSSSGTSLYGSGAAHANILIDDTNGLTASFNSTNYVSLCGLVANATTFTNGGVVTFNMESTGLIPNSDTVPTIGDLTHRVGGVFNAGALGGGYRAASSTVTVAATDHFVGVNGSGSRTVNLPAASAFFAGQELIIQEIGGDAGTITVNRAGSDTINAGTTSTIAAAYGRKVYYSNGVSAWLADASII